MRSSLRRKYLAQVPVLEREGQGRGGLALDPVRRRLPDQHLGHDDLLSAQVRLLEKHGIKFEEFAVPRQSTMSRWWRAQVELGNYADVLHIGQNNGWVVGHRADRNRWAKPRKWSRARP